MAIKEKMKCVLFYLPTLAAVVFYGAVGLLLGVSSISPIVIVWIALFALSGFLLNKNYFWGALFGLLPAIHLIQMGSVETGQMLKESSLGILLFVFYFFCGILVLKKAKNTKK